MKSLLLSLLMLGTLAAAKADQLYVFVSVHCEPEKTRLSITFDPVWNEAGEKLIAEHPANRWETWTLMNIKTDKKGKYVFERKPVSTACVLGKEKYQIAINPETAVGFNPVGWCATRMGADVTVTLSNRVVARAHNDACSDSGAVIKSMTIIPNKAPRYEEVEAMDYFNGGAG